MRTDRLATRRNKAGELRLDEDEDERGADEAGDDRLEGRTRNDE